MRIHSFKPFGKPLGIILFIAGVCPGILASSIPESLTLEQVVPQETIVFVKCSGTEQWIEDGESLDLVRLWGDPEVQAFFADAKKMLPEMLGGGVAMEGFPAKEFWNLFKGEVALACSPRITVFREGAMPSIAFGMDVGGRKEQVLGMLNGLMEKAAAEAGLERGHTEYRNFDMGYIGRPRERWTICHTMIKNLLVATFNPYFLRDIIDHHLDGKPVLADSESFHRSKNKLEADNASALAYVNFEPFCRILEPFWPYEVAEWFDILGLKRVNALCLATTLDGGGSRDSIFIDCPGEKKGLMKALAPHPVSRESLDRVMPDVLVYLGVVLDPEMILKEIDHFVKEAVPEYYKEFRHGLSMVKKETGFDIEHDLFGPLGSELSFFVNQPKTGGLAIPDMILTVGLDDAESFMAVLEKVFAMARHEGINISESGYKDHTLRTVTIPEEGVPITPTFVLDRGRLIVASSPMTMKKYLKWLDEGVPGLADSKDFQVAMAGVPENASILSYANLRRGVEMGYGMAAPFLPSLLAEAEIPLDPGFLPMTETVTDYISNSVSYVAFDEDGIVLGTRSPVGFGAVMSMAVKAVDYLIEENLLFGLVGMGRHVNFERYGRPGFAVAAPKKEAGKSTRGGELDAAYGIMQSGEYEIAEQLFASWLGSHPDDDNESFARLNRGFCCLKLKKFEEGIEQYMIVAEKFPDQRGLALYNVACGTACLKQDEKAFKYLKKAVDAGFDNMEYIKNDPDLEGVRTLPAFKEWMKKRM